MRTMVLGAVLLGLGWLGVASPALAQREARINGQRLVALCEAKDKTAVEACTAYIDGVADGVAFYQRIMPADGSKGGKLPNYVCIQAAVTGTEMRQTVVAWLKKHPERANQQASGVVINALNDSYLCPGEKPRGEPPK